VRRVRSMAALLACSLLSAASSPPEAIKQARLAVVAIGQCDSASSAISARSFRALLQPKLGAALLSEAETARPFGGLSDRTLDEVEHAVAAARKDFYGHKVDAAVGHLKELAVDVTRIAPSEKRWKVERDLLTLLAQAQLSADLPGAEATLAAVLRVEPGYQPDSELYPPSFRKFVDGLRARQAETPTNRLDVAVSPSGKTVYVGGCPVGAAPLSHHFAAGEYRVEADFGHRSLLRTVLVPPPPALVAPIQLAMSIEGALFADGGPCVEPASDRSGTLARVTTLVGASRLLAIHQDVSTARRWAVLEEFDTTGSLLREARVPIQPGAPETDALGALADWAATDRAGSAVEVLKRSGTASPASTSSQSARGQLSGSVLGQPRPNGFTLKAFPVSAQMAPSPGVHFPGDKFKTVDLPLGKTSLRIVTDDGRVGTAMADVRSTGNVDVTVRVELACTAAGRVMNGSGRPAAGAHLVAQQLGSRISQSVETGPKGRFVFKELTRGDYELTVEVGGAHVTRRFSVGSDCTADLGTLMLLDARPLARPPNDGGSPSGPRYR
jgi:Carboxypeptidase regulatory-like domain/PEGA domain